MRKTKIICTIGPASVEQETLKELMLAGMNAARINFSHGGIDEQKDKILNIKKVRDELGLYIPLILDTKGPEIRIGKFENDEIFLNEGDMFCLVNKEITGTQYEFSISYKNLYKEISTGDHILIDDGLIESEVVTIQGTNIYCRVINGGKLSNRKSLNVPGKNLNLPSLTDKDKDDIINGISAGFDFIAASFVRSASDVIAIRDLLDANGGEKVKIISKIENQSGVDNFDSILEVSDGIMIARGDLSVEIPMARVPILQKKMIKKTYRAGKIVITATQMLDSMIKNPRPTRAEVSDIANAVYDVSSAIMLSGETANGKYPVQCVKMMDNISCETENEIDYWERFLNRNYTETKMNYRFRIYDGVCTSAMNLNAKAIIAFTESGDTPGILSAYCPECPIFAITKDDMLARQLNLYWNVTPILITNKRNIDKMFEQTVDMLKERGIVKKGDIIVVAGGDKVLPNFSDEDINKTIGGVVKI